MFLPLRNKNDVEAAIPPPLQPPGPRPEPRNPNSRILMRILIVKLSSLGDILHVLPTVHEIKVGTNAEVDWVVHPEFASLVRCFADVDNVITFPRHKVLSGLKEAVKNLRAKEYDMVIDLHGLFKSGVVTRLARTKRRIGPSYARECSPIFFSELARPPKGADVKSRHAVERAYDTLDYLGIKRPAEAEPAVLRPLDGPLPYPIAECGVMSTECGVAKETQTANVECRPSNSSGSDVQKLVAFAPVSRWKTKDWPCANFADTAKLILNASPSTRIIVVGGKGDYEIGEKIRKADESRIDNLCGKTSIAQSLALLEKCDLLVANDTGPVHMAAAVGTHCLVVFGPTRPDWTGPYGNGHRVIMRTLPCQPCLKRTCKRGDHACMTSILPAEVAEAALEMLHEVNK